MSGGEGGAAAAAAGMLVEGREVHRLFSKNIVPFFKRSPGEAGPQHTVESISNTNVGGGKMSLVNQSLLNVTALSESYTLARGVH